MGDHMKSQPLPALVDRYRPLDHLPEGVGDRPLRLPLCLLHVGAHELPAARGTCSRWRSSTASARRSSAAASEAAHHRRRAARAQEHHVAVRGARRRHLDAGGLEELTLTTNGSQLKRFAARSQGAGVERINVSLDTLAAQTASAPSPAGAISATVMEGLDAADAAGLERQDQRGGAQGHQRGRDRRPHPLRARPRLRPDADRDHAAGRDRRRPHSTSTCRCPSCARGCWTAGRSTTSPTAPAARPATCACARPAAGSASSRR